MLKLFCANFDGFCLNPQVGMLAPFAPSNFGPSGVWEEEKGIMLSEAPESTKKFN
jgi:hypothetical protein